MARLLCMRLGASHSQRHKSKSEISLAELDRVLGAEVRFGVVLADAAYGSSSGFRHALSERGLTWAVGIPRTQKVYSLEVGLISGNSAKTSAGARQASGAIRPVSIPPSSPPASSRAQERQAGGFRCRTG